MTVKVCLDLALEQDTLESQTYILNSLLVAVGQERCIVVFLFTILLVVVIVWNVSHVPWSSRSRSQAIGVKHPLTEMHGHNGSHLHSESESIAHFLYKYRISGYTNYMSICSDIISND